MDDSISQPNGSTQITGSLSVCNDSTSKLCFISYPKNMLRTKGNHLIETFTESSKWVNTVFSSQESFMFYININDIDQKKITEEMIRQHPIDIRATINGDDITELSLISDKNDIIYKLSA